MVAASDQDGVIFSLSAVNCGNSPEGRARGASGWLTASCDGFSISVIAKMAITVIPKLSGYTCMIVVKNGVCWNTYEHPGKPHPAYPNHRTGRRNEGNAKASQIAGQPLLRKAEHIREKNIFQAYPPCGNHTRVGIENTEQRTAEQQYQPADCCSADQTLHQAKS